MSRPVKSLKWRLGLWVFLPTFVISFIDLAVTYRSTDKIATLVQEQLLKGSARIIAEQLLSVDGGFEISVPPAAFELFANKYKDHVFYSVRSKDGKLIAGDAELPAYPGQLPVEQEEYFLSSMRGEEVRVISYVHSLPDKSQNDFAVTQVAQTLHGHAAFRNDLFFLTIREHLILLSIVIFGLVIAFRWTLSPLDQFGKKLLKRTPGSLETLEEKSEPIELHPLIFAINDYVSRLDQALSSYEQFVANTAHQLRTSFAIITSQLNFASRHKDLDRDQKDILNAIQKSVSRGTRVINQLLILAAVERSRQQQNPAALIQVSCVARDVIEALAPVAQQKNIDLGIDELDESLTVAAPQHLMHELISNLVDNAIQHSGDASIVTVMLRRRDNAAVLSVIDNGPGIPAAEREKVFERFYRLDESRVNSSGLGLAIVKEICNSLQAKVELRVPENGVGLQVDVVFSLPDYDRG